MSVYVDGRNIVDIIRECECEKVGIKIGCYIHDKMIVETFDEHHNRIIELSYNATYNGVPLRCMPKQELLEWLANMAAKGKNIRIV